MKVLWLCNVPTPAIGQAANLSVPPGGGWLDALSKVIAQAEGCELHYAFFSKKIPNLKRGVAAASHWYALPEHRSLSEIKRTLDGLVREVNPDVVHIFGSEFLTSYAMVCVCEESGLIDHTLLHIQGLVSVITGHMTSGIPLFWQYLKMPRDIIRDSSVHHVQREYRKRGEFEIRAIKKLRHIVGRTEWDRSCAFHINPDAEYHFCGEVLRETFYMSQWNYVKCEKHSIFVSQANYPFKGLHYVLEAMPLILQHFPNTALYVGGTDQVRIDGSVWDKRVRTGYGAYLLKLIKRFKLENHIHFIGPLDEQGMCARYLKSHLFVSASTIENSPNSLSEAMILGMPCVASYVGGVPSMLSDKAEGLLYQADAPYMLAHYVIELFGKEEMAAAMGQRARTRALAQHNQQTILTNTLSLYESMSKRELLRVQ